MMVKEKCSKKIAASAAQYFNSCRSILDPNENLLETKMTSEKSSTKRYNFEPIMRTLCIMW
jgi:hypothetical protein